VHLTDRDVGLHVRVYGFLGVLAYCAVVSDLRAFVRVLGTTACSSGLLSHTRTAKSAYDRTAVGYLRWRWAAESAVQIGEIEVGGGNR